MLLKSKTYRPSGANSWTTFATAQPPSNDRRRGSTMHFGSASMRSSDIRAAYSDAGSLQGIPSEARTLLARRAAQMTAGRNDPADCIFGNLQTVHAPRSPNFKSLTPTRPRSRSCSCCSRSRASPSAPWRGRRGRPAASPPHTRRSSPTTRIRNAVDQPIMMMPLIPSIADTSRHCSAMTSSL